MNEFQQYFLFHINQDIPSIVIFNFYFEIMLLFVMSVTNKPLLIASHKYTKDK